MCRVTLEVARRSLSEGRRAHAGPPGLISPSGGNADQRTEWLAIVDALRVVSMAAVVALHASAAYMTVLDSGTGIWLVNEPEGFQNSSSNSAWWSYECHHARILRRSLALAMRRRRCLKSRERAAGAGRAAPDRPTFGVAAIPCGPDSHGAHLDAWPLPCRPL